MAPIKSQNSNMLLAFLTLLGVIAIVAVVGFFMLRKGPEIIQGQAEVTEYRVSSKVPGRILEFRVKEGQSVNAGDTLAILEAPDVVAKMEQARAAEAAAQAQNAKAIKGAFGLFEILIDLRLSKLHFAAGAHLIVSNPLVLPECIQCLE